MDGQGDVIGGWLVALYKALLWKGIEPFELLSKSDVCIDEIYKFNDTFADVF